MTALKAEGLEGALRRLDPSISAILIYGEEQAAVHDLAAKVVGRIAGSTDDPFSVVTLDDGDLSGDPARLADEVQSLSMIGGRRAIWVRDAGEAFLKAASAILEGKISGNVVVAEAGVLAKSSSLRTSFEKSVHAWAVPLYEAGEQHLATLVEPFLRRHGLAIGPDARQRFAELAGTSRAIVERELEKLALYAEGHDEVLVEDVEAVVGNASEIGFDDLADNVFLGDVETADRMFMVMTAGGMDPGRIVAAVLGQAMRLQDFKLAIAGGMRMEQVLRSARPPVFFKRHAAVTAQLTRWSLDDLLSAGASLAGAVLQIRQRASLAESIGNRALLAVTRNGRALAMQKP